MTHFSEVRMLDRRRFLLSGVALGGAAVYRNHLLPDDKPSTEPMPSLPAQARDDEAYWAQVRKQFLIPQDVVFLNNGSVGSSPRPVLRAIFDAYEEIEKVSPEDPEDYPFWGYGRPRPFSAIRDEMAAFVGGSRDQIALLRRATESNNIVAHR
ncbi:MAG: aminotransferase class V-fold PLP-dependent enzyme, partial [Gemmatimonadales bacterium]